MFAVIVRIRSPQRQGVSYYQALERPASSNAVLSRRGKVRGERSTEHFAPVHHVGSRENVGVSVFLGKLIQKSLSPLPRRAGEGAGDEGRRNTSTTYVPFLRWGKTSEEKKKGDIIARKSLGTARALSFES